MNWQANQRLGKEKMAGFVLYFVFCGNVNEKTLPMPGSFVL